MEPTESPELESYFAELRQGATFDSEGEFTMDMLAARQKLRDRLMENPRHYVLALVRSAVAGGASRLKFSLSRSGLILEHDGCPPTREELTHIFDYQLRPDRPGDLPPKELATGINTALSLSPKVVAVHSWGPKEALKLALTDSQSSLETTDQAPPSGVTTRISVLVRPAAEAKILADYCGHCPVPIQLGRNQLKRGDFGDTRRMVAMKYYPSNPTVTVATGRPLARRLFSPDPEALAAHNILEARRGPCPSPWGIFLGESKASKLAFLDSGASGDWPPSNPLGAGVCQAGLGFQAGFPTHSVVHFVYLGVGIGTITSDLGVPGLVAVVSAQGLARDLSTVRVVHDRALQERMQEISQWASGLIVETRRSLGLEENVSAAHAVGRILLLGRLI